MLTINYVNRWRITIFLSFFIKICASNEIVLVSQISPKSANLDEYKFDSDDDMSPILTSSHILNLDNKQNIDENNEYQHHRIERSALPILNENESKSKLDIDKVKDNISPNGINQGRYINLIKPTSTVAKAQENINEISKTHRMGKNIEGTNPFLGIRDLRSRTSGSQLIPNNVMQTSDIVLPTKAIPSSFTLPANSFTGVDAPIKPRQNQNPDIQDIITGIVKLLNGNVNVHANTQVHRRPVASRINNRGPPRISEAQPLPIDYDIQKPPIGSSMLPPFSFDNPARPFLNGIPIPEQIVPVSPNSNNRPSGFINPNRNPWQRPRPRPPPINNGNNKNRRPGGTQHIPGLMKDETYNTDASPPPPTGAGPAYTTINLDKTNDTLDVSATDSYDNKNGPSDELEGAEESDNSINASAAIESGNIENESINAMMTPTYEEEELSQKKPNYPNSQPNLHEEMSTTEESRETTLVDIDEDKASTLQPTTVTSIPQVTSSTINIDHSTNENVYIEGSMSDDILFITSMRTSSLDESDYTTTSSSIPDTTKHTPETTVFVTKELSATESSSLPTSSSILPSTPSIIKPSSTHIPTNLSSSYHPRPGIVLDDPEFKPGGIVRPSNYNRPQIQPTRQHLLPGYGEIFDVTLSAIQGPGNGASGSKQTINIKPYGGGANSNHNQNDVVGYPINIGNDDIIISPSGDQGFVSIDGKRTYINLFGEPTDAPSVPTPASETTSIQPSVSPPGITHHHPHVSNSQHKNNSPGSSNQHDQQPSLGIGYVEPDLTPIKPQLSKIPQRTNSIQGNNGGLGVTGINQRPHYRPRTTQPPVRIDTCIVGDDSTCDQAQNERCRTENGVSSCHCRPGYSRRKHREPCRRVVSFFLSLRVDRIYERRIVWDEKLRDKNSEHFGQLSYESIRAIDSAMSMTPFSDEFMEAKVNNIYQGDPSRGAAGVFVNLTMKLEENSETLRPTLRSDVQKHLLGVIHRRNNNIGNSVLYVESPPGSISNLQDLDECQSQELNDCHRNAQCTNIWGSFRCQCNKGFRDPWSDQPQRAGKECQTCPDSHCNNRGTCNYDMDGLQICTCEGNFYGSQCEIDGEVLGVAIGASVAAVIIIVFTLVCLIMWSRRWRREQKNAIGSPVFGYMNTAPIVKNGSGLGHPAYQVTLEDRMRWAQIADVIAQSNHYGSEPVANSTRPSSAMFGYPNLQAMGMGTLVPVGPTALPIHHSSGTQLQPPVPLPRRLGIQHRSNGMRTLENSSSSEEEDRTDLLGRNFHVPRPKSRSNGSITNQSGIYYDVEYEPSGCDLYGGTTTTSISNNNLSVHHNTTSGPQGIPMSTYTSSRTPASTYYMK
ncbi:uncharacterized protein LOC129614628 [Condylostylus longicornis]|uniref:uncharacterized protein LOC129614628 n=1 Tax=Condylostylus longicornis TaxID=2530218 RepID=UPI00244DEF32|nr:uncharacterized protein LOC129614628 [Condylostylus longicornis]